MEWQRLSERPLKEAKVQITKHLGQGGGLQLVGVLSGLLPIRSTVHTCSMVRVPGCRCMQGASACLAFMESDLSGIQTKSGIKKKAKMHRTFYLGFLVLADIKGRGKTLVFSLLT